MAEDGNLPQVLSGSVVKQVCGKKFEGLGKTGRK
jgi:hypothetical protein